MIRIYLYILLHERFLRDSIKLKSLDECWWIPISYGTQDGPLSELSNTRPKRWMSCPKFAAGDETITGLADANHWVLINIQAAGKNDYFSIFQL